MAVKMKGEKIEKGSLKLPIIRMSNWGKTIKKDQIKT